MPRTGKTPDGKPRGLDAAVAERVGRVPGPAGRVPLVRQCRRAPGTACRRGVATWSPASRSDSGPPRARGLERPLCRRPVRAGRARATPRASARWPTSAASGSGSWPAPWRSRRRTTRSSGSRSREELLDRFARREAGRRLPRRRLRRLVPARAPEARRCGWSPDYVPRERWNMALAVRAKDTQLLVEINRALAQLAESGELRKIYAESRRAVPSPVHGDGPAARTRCRTPGGGSASAASWSSAWTPPTCPIRAPGTTARVSTSSWPGPWPIGCI